MQSGRPNQTGYRFVYYFRDRYGIAINRKGVKLRAGPFASIYDAVKAVNESGHANYQLPGNPHAVLDGFIERHRAPDHVTTPLDIAFRRIKAGWEHVARAPLTKTQLSKMLRARGFELGHSKGQLCVFGLAL